MEQLGEFTKDLCEWRRKRSNRNLGKTEKHSLERESYTDMSSVKTDFCSNKSINQ